MVVSFGDSGRVGDACEQRARLVADGAEGTAQDLQRDGVGSHPLASGPCQLEHDFTFADNSCARAWRHDGCRVPLLDHRRAVQALIGCERIAVHELGVDEALALEEVRGFDGPAQPVPRPRPGRERDRFHLA